MEIFAEHSLSRNEKPASSVDVRAAGFLVAKRATIRLPGGRTAPGTAGYLERLASDVYVFLAALPQHATVFDYDTACAIAQVFAGRGECCAVLPDPEQRAPQVTDVPASVRRVA